MTTLKHPLAKIAYPDWLRLKELYGNTITHTEKRQFIEKTSKDNEVFRLEEQEKYGEKINKTTIAEPPVFLMGHWRSGTTFLQNVLTQDHRFGYLNVVQSLNPHTFLSREQLYKDAFQETKRFMDNVKLTGDAPSEEEVALGITAPGSFWHGYYFTDHFDYYFKKYTLFDGIAEEELEAWKKSYLHLLKKLTLRYDGKPLLLKNPPNTGRIAVLLDLFPNAKFIHIHRNPYEVYLSRMSQYDTAVRFKTLQHFTKENWEGKVFKYYEALLKQHFEQRDLIPEGNYFEVSFHELKSRPMETLQRIYYHLSLPDFSGAQPFFKQYLDNIRSYRQNTYTLSPEQIRKIEQHWQFAIDCWKYEIPEKTKRAEPYVEKQT